MYPFIYLTAPSSTSLNHAEEDLICDSEGQCEKVISQELDEFSPGGPDSALSVPNVEQNLLIQTVNSVRVTKVFHSQVVLSIRPYKLESHGPF